jgi:hypothetical protein
MAFPRGRSQQPPRRISAFDLSDGFVQLPDVPQRAVPITPANRVSGQPLFLNDPNSSDPKKNFVLNPAAWADPASGDWGTAAKYYSDYRDRRRPDEQVSVGKSIKFHEGVSLSLRFELFNAFNRLRLAAPTSTNAKATPLMSNGVPQSGFGYVNPTSANNAAFGPRTGQIVARPIF